MLCWAAKAWPESSQETACRAEVLRQGGEDTAGAPWPPHPGGHHPVFRGGGIPEHGDATAAVMQAADAALYWAKQAGRDGVVVARGDSAGYLPLAPEVWRGEGWGVDARLLPSIRNAMPKKIVAIFFR